MEELVRTALSKYTGFVAEAELYERWLSARENPEIRNTPADEFVAVGNLSTVFLKVLSRMASVHRQNLALP